MKSMFLKRLVLVCVFNYLMLKLSAKSDLRINYGREAKPGEFSFVVRVEWQKLHIYVDKTTLEERSMCCTGAALKPKWTLTAEHCTTEKHSIRTHHTNITEELKMVIVYGDLDKVSAVLKNEIHSRKISATSLDYVIRNDIALLKTEPMLVDKFAKISGLDYRTIFGMEVTVVGFGLVKQGATSLNDTLNLGSLQVIDRAMVRSCDTDKRVRALDAFPAMCLVPTCRKMQFVSNGDSGAPVLHASGVIGVISRGIANMAWNQNTSRNKVINYLTPISPFLDWIFKVTDTE